MLSREQIQKFQILYEQRFGKRISEEEAYEKGMQLITLMKHSHTASLKTKKRNERRIKNEHKPNKL